MGNRNALSFGSLLAIFALYCSSNAFATVRVKDTAVEQFRIKSHYGPEEALLIPVFPHESKLEFSGGAGLAPLSSLHKSWSYSGSMTYHINRRHAVEPIFYLKTSGELSDFVKEQIRDKSSAGSNSSLSVTLPQQVIAGSYLFSPYHAKLHLSSFSVSHFDVYMGAGVGAAQSQQLALDGGLGDSKWRVAGVLTAGFRMLFQPRFALRVEFRDIIHGQNNFARLTTGHNFHMGASLSVFFGSF